MRGTEQLQEPMFSYISAEKRVPKEHPLRPLRGLVDEILRGMSKDFEQMYSNVGRPSIPPEQLLRALLIQALYSVRSERMLMEQLDYNMLFRWFVGLSLDDEIWDVTVFTKNRDRLLEADVAKHFLDAVVEQARGKRLLSNEHYSVDGTLIKAWAGQKSFKKKDQPKTTPPDDPGNPTVNFRGEQRRNDTHQSTTDPEARLYRKGGQESLLSFLGHLIVENRNGLVVRAQVSSSTGTAERETAINMVKKLSKSIRRITLGADKAYDTKEFVRQVRELNVTPHVAQNVCRNRHSAIDKRTTVHAGYAISQKKRKRIEEVFGWMKTVGLMRQTRHRGADRIGWMFTFAAAAYNLVRIRNLTMASA